MPDNFMVERIQLLSDSEEPLWFEKKLELASIIWHITVDFPDRALAINGYKVFFKDNNNEIVKIPSRIILPWNSLTIELNIPF